MKDRMEVVNFILEAYKERHCRQEDIAKDLKLTDNQVGMVTREGNYSHTIYKDVDNLNEGQTINMVSYFGGSKFDFLDNVILPEKDNDENHKQK